MLEAEEARTQKSPQKVIDTFNLNGLCPHHSVAKHKHVFQDYSTVEVAADTLAQMFAECFKHIIFILYIIIF